MTQLVTRLEKDGLGRAGQRSGRRPGGGRQHHRRRAGSRGAPPGRAVPGRCPGSCRTCPATDHAARRRRAARAGAARRADRRADRDARRTPRRRVAVDGCPRRGFCVLSADHPRYKWVALSNTTLGMLLATINASIVLISLPAIFNGHPPQPARARQRQLPAVDADGLHAGHRGAGGHAGPARRHVRPGAHLQRRLRASSRSPRSSLSLDPFDGGGGALWLIGWRVLQAVGGAMLMANSAAIITDAFPATQRGMALGVNIVAALAGSFIGLVARRRARRVELALDLLGQRADRPARHRLGVPVAARHRRAPARRGSTGGATSTFAVGLTALLAGDHLRHPALRRAHRWAGPTRGSWPA